MALTTAAGSCAGAVDLALAGPPVEAAGGGVGVTGDEEGASTVFLGAGDVAGAEGSGTVLVFFLGTGGTRGSARLVSLLPAPVLLAPVSWVSGGETRLSSARWSEGSGAARPVLVLPP